MLDWLTTVPGILVIFGIVLLVIAIILFVTGAKRPKKEVMGSFDNNNYTVMNNGVDVNSVTPVTPVVPLQNNIDNSNGVSDINSQQINTTVNTPEIQTFGTQEVINNNIQDSVVSPVVNEQISDFQPSYVQEPEVSILSNVETPSFNDQVENSTPVFDIPEMNVPVQEVSNPVVEEFNTIYGGEVPTVDFTSPDEPVTIYGGNDPLEATQTLPKIDEYHEPYGGNYPEVKVLDSVTQEPVVASVEEILPQEPLVAPAEEVINEEPSVLSVEESITQEPSVTAVEEVIPQEPSVTPVINSVEDSVVEIPTINPIAIDTPVEQPVISNTTVTPIEVSEVIEEL